MGNLKAFLDAERRTHPLATSSELEVLGLWQRHLQELERAGGVAQGRRLQHRPNFTAVPLAESTWFAHGDIPIEAELSMKDASSAGSNGDWDHRNAKTPLTSP